MTACAGYRLQVWKDREALIRTESVTGVNDASEITAIFNPFHGQFSSVVRIHTGMATRVKSSESAGTRFFAFYLLGAGFLLAPYLVDMSLNVPWRAHALAWFTTVLLLIAQARDRLICAMFNAFALFFVIVPFIYQDAFGYDLNTNRRVGDLSWNSLMSFALYLGVVNLVALGEVRSKPYGAGKALPGGVGFVLAMLCLPVFILFFGVEPLWSTRLEQWQSLETETISQFISDVLKITPFIIALVVGSQNKCLGPFYWATIVVGLIMCNPINSPRIFALAGLLMALTPSLRRWGIFRSLPLIFSVAMYILMPLTSLLRYGFFDSGVDIWQAFHSAEFSAMQVLEDGFHYFQHDDFGLGRFLGSALFVFVPRILWTDKNTGTGITIGDATGYPNANVSVSPHFDAWLDFGLPGVVVFGLIVGGFLRLLTKWSWNGYAAMGWRSHLFTIFLFCTPIFVRGDSMTATRVIYNFLLAYGIVAILAGYFGKRMKV